MPSTLSSRVHLTLLAALGCLALTACERPARVDAKPAPQADTIALLDGTPISRLLLDEVARQQVGKPNPYDLPTAADSTVPVAPVTPEYRQHLLDELIEIELLARKAQERGIDKQPGLQAEIELQEKTILERTMVREQIATIEVSDAELAAAYDERVPPYQFKIAHIVLADVAAAQDVIRQLQQGRPFADLARRLSLDADTRRQGGRIGSLMFDQMPVEIAPAVRHLKPGAHTPPVQTAQGWHVVQLEGLEPLAERPSLQAARVWLHPQIVHAKVLAQQQQWRREAQVQLASPP